MNNPDSLKGGVRRSGPIFGEEFLAKVDANVAAQDAAAEADRFRRSRLLMVTRHQALVEFLRETIGYLPADASTYDVVEHVKPEDVVGRHVVGVLPLRLAALAASVTEVPLDIPAELRGRELNLEEVEKYAGLPVTYVVTRQKGDE